MIYATVSFCPGPKSKNKLACPDTCRFIPIASMLRTPTPVHIFPEYTYECGSSWQVGLLKGSVIIGWLLKHVKRGFLKADASFCFELNHRIYIATDTTGVPSAIYNHDNRWSLISYNIFYRPILGSTMVTYFSYLLSYCLCRENKSALT